MAEFTPDFALGTRFVWPGSLLRRDVSRAAEKLSFAVFLCYFWWLVTLT